MNSTKPLPPLNVPALLARYRLLPSKGLGQNFLTDDGVLAEIVQAAGIDKTSVVLEIGPGLGSLTRRLAAEASQVIAVELDRKMIPVLNETLAPFSNVAIVQSDILAYDPGDAFAGESYCVVANIPYYITSAVIRHLLELRTRPDRISLTIQKEVAERICAEPGDFSLLSLSVRIYGEPRCMMTIGKEAFYPVPKIDSALVRIDLYDEPLIPRNNADAFFKLIKAGFGQKRKTLRNALTSGLALDKTAIENALSEAEIDPKRRAETLTIDEWKQLLSVLNRRSGGQ